MKTLHKLFLLPFLFIALESSSQNYMNIYHNNWSGSMTVSNLESIPISNIDSVKYVYNSIFGNVMLTVFKNNCIVFNYETQYIDSIVYSNSTNNTLPNITTYQPNVSLTCDSIIFTMPSPPPFHIGYINHGGNGVPIIQKGICFSTTNSNPTIFDSLIVNNDCLIDAVNNFWNADQKYFKGGNIPRSKIPGFNNSSIIYVKPYLTTSLGTSYGNTFAISGVAGGFQNILPQTDSIYSIGLSGNTAKIATSVSFQCAPEQIIERGVEYSTSPFLSNSQSVSFASGSGPINFTITNLSPNQTYYVRGYAVNNLATRISGNIQNFSFPATNPNGLSLGQNYGGGIIFYLDSTGQHGLISSTTDYGPLQWSSGTSWPGHLVPGATATCIGCGETNTDSIIAYDNSNSIAARFCKDLILNGYSNWYLPSKDELDLMTLNSSLISLNNQNYWTSSQLPAQWNQSMGTFYNSWYLDRTSGMLGFWVQGFSTNSYYFRPIRKF